MGRSVAITYFVLSSLCAIFIGQSDSTTEVGEPARRKWLSELFLQAESEFEISPEASDHCRSDYEYYRAHLSNQSVWAVRMMESSEWPIVGIFAGTTERLGNFDECLRASSNDVYSQYCLPTATILDETAIVHEVTQYPDEQASAWEVLKMYKLNPVRINRHKLRWALCMPRSCSPHDLSISLNRTLNPLFNKQGIKLDINVDPKFCKSKRDIIVPSSGYYYTKLFYGFLLFLIICSTVYDTTVYKKPEKKQEQSLRVELFRAFSLPKNFTKLKKISPSEYPFIHFIKIVYLLFVIYGHRFIYFIGYPKFDAEATEELYTSSSIELIHTNVVDIFFMVSGFLTFQFGFTPMLKGGSLYLLLSIVFRWIRMVPVFIILMLYIMYILPYTSEGPLWDFRIWSEVNKCKSSWWANLLAVNNFVKTEDQCLVVSWYISTDIQLAILGSILLYIITKNKKIGIFLTTLVFLASAGATFAVAYVNNYDGLLRLYMSLLEEPRNSEQFNKFYIATYTRAGPYLLGFAAAYLAKTLRDREFKFTGKQMAFGSILSILIGEGIQYYGCLFYLFGRPYNPLENGIYAAFNRTIFAFPIAWHLCMFFTSGLGIAEKVLVRKIYVPLGRLTYSVFLVNTVVQMYHSSSQMTIIPSSLRINLVWWAVADVVLSYAVGLCLHLFAEAPMTNLSKMIQKIILRKFIKAPVEKIAATDAAFEKPVQFGNSLRNEAQLDRSQSNGYQNESFVSNEVVPKVSESSHV